MEIVTVESLNSFKYSSGFSWRNKKRKGKMEIEKEGFFWRKMMMKKQDVHTRRIYAFILRTLILLTNGFTLDFPRFFLLSFVHHVWIKISDLI